MTSLLVALTLGCAAWAVTAGVLVARDLQRRGIAIHFPWLRAMILGYLAQYRRMTLEETGHTGPLFYHYVVPLIVALALGIVLIVHEL